MARKPLQHKAAPEPRDSISDPVADLTALPAGVAAMRARILTAVEANDIEALRPAIEFNETPPIFGREPRAKNFAQAIDVLKARSFDGKGAEIVAILKAIFEQPYAIITRGPIVTYVWPAFAAKQRPDIAPETRIDMYRCSRFANIRLVNDIGLPLIERVGIGADGTWHYFFSG